MIKTVKKYLIAHKGNDYKPHILKESSVLFISIVAFIIFCTSLGGDYVLNKTNFGAAVLPSVLVDLTNEHRVENNGKVLAVNPLLEKAALMKAKDMAEKGYFAHTSPEGITPWQWFYKAGYNFVYAGENLAINFSESSDVENAWIASSTHHANLISNSFDETGIATYDGVYKGQNTTFVVQLFGKRSKADSQLKEPVIAKEQKSVVKKVALDTKPEVKGESIYVEPPKPVAVSTPVVLVEEPFFAIAQDQNATPLEVNANDNLQGKKYSNLGQRFLVKQAKFVQNIYLILITLIYIALISLIVVEARRHHTKNILLAIVLLCLLGALAYVNSTLVISIF